LAQPPTADASLGLKRVNALGALDYAKEKLLFALCEHNVRREHVVPFFDLLAQSSDPDKFTFLTLDNASIDKNIDPEIPRRWQTEHKFFLLYSWTAATLASRAAVHSGWFRRKIPYLFRVIRCI
jgi:hypothetical protein